MPASDIKFPLRIPVGLDGELRKRAGVAGISLNTLICGILGEALDGFGEVSGVESPQEVSGVRGGVRKHGRGKRATAVRGPQHGTQPDTGAVGERLRDNPSEQRAVQGEGKELSVMDRPYTGPAHAKTCGCTVCKLKRGGK